MRSWRSSNAAFAYLALLRCASWLVPSRQRAEWFAEWRSELWYVRQSCGWQPIRYTRGIGTAMAFCLGAFQDALWLRRNSPAGRLSFRLQTARHCGIFLALIAAASLALTLHSPGARKALARVPVANADNLVHISREGYLDSTSPTISLDEYRGWKHRSQSLFTEFAYYRPLVTRTQVTPHTSAVLSVELASDNLFKILNIQMPFELPQDAKSRHKPRLIVSETAWHKVFNSDPYLVGKVLEVAGQQAMVVAILPDDAWRLTRHMDAWLLEDDSYLKSPPADTFGFVVGHIATAALTNQTRGRWLMSAPTDGIYENFDCVPLNRHIDQPFGIFLFTFVLACLALPATTPLPLGDYPATDRSLSSATRWRRWLFLLMKIGLTLPIVYCGSLSVAFLKPSMSTAASVYIQFATSFLALLFSFRWALRDQRRRCPVCLRLLTNPARVGHPSRNFLAWHGTEFMCDEGHGLLHVPEIATTWFSTQRWLYLDSSWKGLFPEPSIPFSGVF
jgi:hypothetical protein